MRRVFNQFMRFAGQLLKLDLKVRMSMLFLAFVSITALSFQNCSKVAFKAVGVDSSSTLATANFCQANQPQTCDVLDSKGVKVGVGTFMCDSKIVKSSADFVKAASNCQLGSCLSGYQALGNSCVPNTCNATNPPQTTPCKVISSTGVITGNGTATCKSDGSGFGECVLNSSSCTPGFVFNSTTKKCDPKACDPNPASETSKRTCDQAAGSGYQYCLADGSGYESACVFTACKTGYHEVPQAGIPAHPGVQCEANTCTPKSGPYPCTDANKTGTGTMTCNDYGTGYNACVLTACSNPPYKPTPENGVCVNTACSPGSPVACTVANGSGVKTCDSSGQVPTGSCPVTKCDSGYVIVGGTSCLKQVCDPKIPSLSNKCTIANATGTVQSCNSDGTLLGECLVTSCAANYTPSTDKKSCVPSSCSNGAFNYNDPIPANACTLCAPGSEMWPMPMTSASSCIGKCSYELSRQADGSCKCSAGSVSSSGVSSCNVNGTGQMKCVADGSGFACEYVSCNLGYQLNSTTKQCVACAAAPTGGIFTTAGSCSWSCDATQGLIKSADGKSCVPSNPSCSNGQYPNQGSCLACTNKPANSIYTSSGTTATNCAYACNSGYTGTDCHARYEWKQTSVSNPSSTPQQCGTSISQTYPVICVDNTTTPATTVSSSLCDPATKPTASPGTTSTYQAADCTCPTGQIPSVTRLSCEDIVCAEGKYLSGSSCMSCPSGTTSPAGSTSSASCVSTCSKAPTYSGPVVGGSVSGVLNSASCSYTYSLSCNPGNYMSTIPDTNLSSVYGLNNQSCQACAAGSSCDGSTKVVTCPANTYSTAGSSTCKSCASGTTSPAGSTSSAACVASCTKAATYSGPVVGGWVSGVLNSATCSYTYSLSCNPGNYLSSITDSSLSSVYGLNNQSCQACAAGSSCDGSTKVVTCPANTYSTAGASSCTSCPVGMTSPSGSKSPTACTASCAAAQTSSSPVVGGWVSGLLNTATCSYTYTLSCNPGYYMSNISDSNLVAAYGISNKSCQLCKAGSSCDGTASITTCPANSYSLAGAGSCTSCPTGTVSAAGSTSASACVASCTKSASYYGPVVGGSVSGTLNQASCSYSYSLSCNSPTYKIAGVNDTSLASVYGISNQSCQCSNGATTASSCATCPSGSYMNAGSCAVCSLAATTDQVVTGGYVSGTLNSSTCSYSYTTLTCNSGYTKSTVNDPALATAFGISNQSCQKLPTYTCNSVKMPSSTCYQSGPTCIAQGDIVNIVSSGGCQAGANTATNISTTSCGGAVTCSATWSCPNGSGGTVSCSSTGTAPTYTGTWTANQPPACPTTCGSASSTQVGTVTCSVPGTCDPATQPSPITRACSAVTCGGGSSSGGATPGSPFPSDPCSNGTYKCYNPY